MSNDKENDHFTDSKDNFYESDYDEDTVDYDLDSDTFLEEENLDPDAAAIWGVERPVSNSPDGPDNEQAAESELEYEQEPGSDEQWYDEDDTSQAQDGYSDAWPLGLIAVGIIALLLLAAGGYGVLQQRTEMQEEVRQLRATLATSTSNTELASSRQAQRSLTARNAELQAQIELLTGENQTLREDVARSLTLSKPETVETVEPPNREPAPEQQPSTTPTKPAPVVTTSKAPGATWFVNFSSYTQEATANNWASKLKVEEGRVVVLSGKKANTQYYRVRVVDLPNREIAEKIALQLQQTYKLPRLWVGKQ